MTDSRVKKIWLVRHAQSKAQTEEEYGIDTGLSKHGIKQAKRLAKTLSKIRFDKIYLSPLKRARETFELSNIKCPSVEFDTRTVEELPEGGYLHILPYEILPGYAENDRHNAWLLNGRLRAANLMEDLYSINARNVMVLSHCGFLNHLFNAFVSNQECGLFEKFKYCQINNAGISVLSIGTESKMDSMLAWNDIRHVYDLVNPDPLAPLADA